MIDIGDKVLSIPDGTGERYVIKYNPPGVGDKIIAIPSSSGKPILVKTGTAQVGDKCMSIPDGLGGRLVVPLAYSVGNDWNLYGSLSTRIEYMDSDRNGTVVVVLNSSSWHMWRSIDYGLTWNPTGPDLPVSSGLLYIGNSVFLEASLSDDSNGLFRSIDNGATFSHATEVTERIASFGINGPGRCMLTGGYNSGGIPPTHFYYSTDYGMSFTQAEFIRLMTTITYIGEGTCLSHRSGYDIIYKSTDYGATWNESFTVVQCYYLCSPDDGICLGGYSNVWMTTDYGSTWNDVYDIYSITGCLVRCFLNVGGGVVLMGANNPSTGYLHIFRSEDYGATWKNVYSISGHGEISCMAYAGNGTCLAGTTDGTLLRSIK